MFRQMAILGITGRAKLFLLRGNILAPWEIKNTHKSNGKYIIIDKESVGKTQLIKKKKYGDKKRKIHSQVAVLGIPGGAQFFLL